MRGGGYAVGSALREQGNDPVLARTCPQVRCARFEDAARLCIGVPSRLFCEELAVDSAATAGAFGGRARRSFVPGFADQVGTAWHESLGLTLSQVHTTCACVLTHILAHEDTTSAHPRTHTPLFAWIQAALDSLNNQIKKRSHKSHMLK